MTRRTYKERAAYFIAKVSERRRKIKEMAVDSKGGKYSICGYNKYIGALEFHHIDPNKKDFGLGMSGMTRSWERVQKELAKCLLVCANCHREIHGGRVKVAKLDKN